MSIIFRTQENFTDTSLPTLKVDEIIPNTQGALFLALPSITTDTSFLNVNTGSIYNFAESQAVAMVGGTQADINGVTSRTFSTPAAGKIEMSTKKGIHVINSQVSSANGNGFAINLPIKIKEYLANNPSHDIFLSIWGSITRASNAVSDQYSHAAISGSNINQSKLLYMSESNNNSNDSLGNRKSQTSFKTLGPYIRNIGAGSWFGTPPAPASMLAYYQLGSKDIWNSFDVNRAASGIIYKFYIEDLTASGRTYAQVDAIDFALYTAAFSPGGRFYADTFTDPNSIP